MSDDMRLYKHLTDPLDARIAELEQKVVDATGYIDKILDDDEWWEELGLDMGEVEPEAVASEAQYNVRQAIRAAREETG